MTRNTISLSFKNIFPNSSGVVAALDFSCFPKDSVAPFLQDTKRKHLLKVKQILKL